MRRTQTNKQGKQQMGKRTRRHLYRMFCMVSLVIAVYLVADLIISGTLNLKVILVFILFLTAIIWGTINQKLNEEEIRNQERELKLYQLYIQPLEELVKEIRVRQHEFDNHINAILNMHLTVDDYDQLVECQSAYIQDVYKRQRRMCLNSGLRLWRTEPPHLQLHPGQQRSHIRFKILRKQGIILLPPNTFTEERIICWSIRCGIRGLKQLL